MELTVTLHFEKGYIANPYWPELEKLINIQKMSGLKRSRSEDKSKKTLEAWLRSHDMTADDYRALEAQAARAFYTVNGAGSEILIPAHHLHGMIAQAVDMAPSSLRFCRKEQIRTMLEFSDFKTGKTAQDGVWERFVTVKSGTGQTLSNQRGLRSNPYIANFDARGGVHLVDAEIKGKFLDLLRYAGREIGVGASRKMGWGRFEVQDGRLGDRS